MLRPPRGHAGELRRGPGWFDSSHDLQRGLEVREGLPEDLKLKAWLDEFCGDQREPSARALATASPSSMTAIA